uniref:Uncharacterized protein n=1 Tax=Pectinophora gossypiella TaxID=13191 RepID=A0A1E1WN06_PECGO
METSYARTKVRVLAICFGKTDSKITRQTAFNCLDKEFEDSILATLHSFEAQTAEVAAQGVAEAFQQGASGTAWLVARSRPAKNITNVLIDMFSSLQDEI